MHIERAFARTLSYLLHPLLIPTYGVLVLFNLNTYIGASIPPGSRLFVLAIMLVNTVLAPSLAIVLLKRFGLIPDFSLHERNDRQIPLLITSLLYMLTYYLIRQLPLPSLMYYYLMGASLLVLICFMISFRWKISLHMVSAGGFTGVMITTSLLLRTDLSAIIMAAIVVSGMVGYARLRLQAHSPAEVYAGYMTGFTAMLLLYLYLRH